MKIFLTGVTGYIGKRLLIQLLEEGHTVVCSVRDRKRFSTRLFQNHLHQIEIVENDFLDDSTLQNIPKDIDYAYYLIHSMSSGDGNFDEKEKISAENFKHALEKTSVKQVIFLTGIINEEKLSKPIHSDEWFCLNQSCLRSIWCCRLPYLKIRYQQDPNQFLPILSLSLSLLISVFCFKL